MNSSEKLNLLYERYKNCSNCMLHKTRNNFVFGEGSASAEVLFIGEAPGREEDLQGKPFVGKSGKLLTSIIEKGMKLKREDVYITNIVKSRPTINYEMKTDRPPKPEEIAACKSILEEQIDIIKPKVIITLGNPATKFILKTEVGITKMRGTIGDYKGIPVIPTYHPSYVLRNGGDNSPLKKDVWEDIKKVLAIIKKNVS